MTFGTLIRRSLRFHWRAHLGVVLGAAIGSAALIGALVVGDSVRGSLREQAVNRLGDTHFAIASGDRFFRANLPERMRAFGTGSSSNFTTQTPAAPLRLVHTKVSGTVFSGDLNSKRASALWLTGVVSRQDGEARANRVNVIGADASWPSFARWQDFEAPRGHVLSDDPVKLHEIELEWAAAAERAAQYYRFIERWRDGEFAIVNQRLAQQLNVKQDDEIVVRVRKPSALAQDAIITPRDESSVAMRFKVGEILPDNKLADISLSVGASSPANLFLAQDFLGKKVGFPNRANLMVNGPVWASSKNVHRWLPGWKWLPSGLRNLEPSDTLEPAPPEDALSRLTASLHRVWRLEDAQLSVRAIEQPQPATGGEYITPSIEISTSRIFLEPAVVAAALKPRTELLTNHSAFASDTERDVAFSQCVTNGIGVLTYLANLIQSGDRATPYSMVAAADAPFVPADMRDDEILVNEWLAEDLNVKAGGHVHLVYYLPDSGSQLIERTNSFRVRAVVPMRGVYADRTLMPEFPGLAKAESTHDWDAGFPLVHTIRDKDEAYWKQFRGTPKAFVTLAAGQSMWANRFGSLTAIRIPVPTNTFPSTVEGAVYRNLLANLNPADVGLRFEPVRERAMAAAAESQDFGQLFLGFSIFLITAALLLMALLFQFGLEQRTAEVGTLLALGFTARQVRRLLLLEGAALALAGGVIGALGGIAYAKAMLLGLATVWRDAVGESALYFHATPASVVIGVLASSIVATLTIWLALRKQARRPARELLAGEVQSGTFAERSRGKWIALGASVVAIGIVVWALVSGEAANAGAFFGAGALLLIAGLGFAASWMATLARRAAASHFTVSSLGVRGCSRRRTRSLATVALLACGSFIILSIGVFRLDANRDATKRTSGTGGFALIGESTLPVVQDLNTESGRDFFGLDERDLAGVHIVQFRVREGDDASCLNLNRAQQPRLLGVNPALLHDRFTFTKGDGWRALEQSAIRNPQSAIEIPAIGDANSIQWALGKKVGDTLDYVDERGKPFKVRIVGAVANSILQGSLIIDETEFVRRFPGESGYRMFLLDAPSNSVSQVSATLSRALEDVGMELTPAAARLNAFNAVQNTYLGTFQILGGLGLLLGSAGLGVVVLRNVLERRGELGVLIALGFRRRALHWLVLSEHGVLLGLGLGIGLSAAAVAVLPALLSPGGQLPYVSLALTLGAVLANGVIWTWLATRYALRGDLLAALRNE